MRVNKFYQCPNSQVSEPSKCPSFQARLICKGPFNWFGSDRFSKSKRLILKEFNYPIEQKIPGSEELTPKKIFRAFRTAFEMKTQKLPGVVVLKQSTVFPNSLSLDYKFSGKTLKGVDSRASAPKDPFPKSQLLPYFEDDEPMNFDCAVQKLADLVEDLIKVK